MKTNLLESKQVGILYHVCSVRKMAYNCEHDSLSGGSFYGNSRTSQPVISFTRDKRYIVCTHANSEDPVIQLEIDGNLLSERYKTEPYNDWDYRGKLDQVIDIKDYSASELEELGLPGDLDLSDVFYHPEDHGLKKGSYDRLYDLIEYDIDHSKAWRLRQRVLFDWCMANKVKVPYEGDVSEQRPVTDRQSEEIVVGDIKDLHKYIKSVNFTVGDYFFTNTLGEFEGESLVSDTLNHIKVCISYFKKWSIPTKFVKLDYSYRNSNHKRATEFDLVSGLTDLSSLYSLYSRYLKNIELYKKTLKSLLSVKDKYSEFKLFDWVSKYKGDDVVSESDLRKIEDNINKNIDILKSGVYNAVSDCDLWVAKRNSKSFKPCDEKYLNRYLFKRYSVSSGTTLKKLFMYYDKTFYCDSDIEKKKIGNHFIFSLFSFSGYKVYMQII